MQKKGSQNTRTGYSRSSLGLPSAYKKLVDDFILMNDGSWALTELSTTWGKLYSDMLSKWERICRLALWFEYTSTYMEFRTFMILPVFGTEVAQLERFFQFTMSLYLNDLSSSWRLTYYNILAKKLSITTEKYIDWWLNELFHTKRK